eukprot:134481-Amphidinium_carterae.1
MATARRRGGWPVEAYPPPCPFSFWQKVRRPPCPRLLPPEPLQRPGEPEEEEDRSGPWRVPSWRDIPPGLSTPWYRHPWPAPGHTSSFPLGKAPEDSSESSSELEAPPPGGATARCESRPAPS